MVARSQKNPMSYAYVFFLIGGSTFKAVLGLNTSSSTRTTILRYNKTLASRASFCNSSVSLSWKSWCKNSENTWSTIYYHCVVCWCTFSFIYLETTVLTLHKNILELASLLLNCRLFYHGWQGMLHLASTLVVVLCFCFAAPVVISTHHSDLAWIWH